MLQEAEIKKIREEMGDTPQLTFCLDALKIVQGFRGWISDEAVCDIADILECDPGEVDSIATFYNLIYRRPVGKHVILLCDSITCWIMGYETLADYLFKKLSIQFGETTSDGLFTLLPAACLGVCEKAPAMMIDHRVYDNLTVEKVDEIIDFLREVE